MFDEARYFQRGDESPVYVIAGVDVGVNVCEDIWNPDGPTRDQALAGAEVIININASPYHRGKGSYRETMISARASDNVSVICYVNAVGGQDELVFDGHSLIFDQRGVLVARGAQFREDLIVYDIDVDAVAQSRLRETRFRIERAEPASASTKLVVSNAPFRASNPQASSAIPPLLDSVAEVWEALVLGVRDYICKTGFEKVLIGLSGGIDSSIVAAIAVDALGPEYVVGVSMPSRFSSDGSKTDAQALADRRQRKALSIVLGENAHHRQRA